MMGTRERLVRGALPIYSRIHSLTSDMSCYYSRKYKRQKLLISTVLTFIPQYINKNHFLYMDIGTPIFGLDPRS